jgi:tetratricopeptide (TPR) repeat protein
MPDGSLARRVIVKLATQLGYDRQTYTDDSGRYEFSELPRGFFLLSARSIDDPKLTSDVVEAETGRGALARFPVNLFLRVRSDKTVTKASSPVVSTAEMAQRVPGKARKSYDKGLKLVSQGKREQAERHFTRAIAAFPGYFQAYAERGSAHAAAGKISEAAADFRHALEINPRYGPALRGSGICNFQLGRYSEAAAELEKAAAMEPAAARNFLLLGVVQAVLNRTNEALASLRHALWLDPEGCVRARLHLAKIYIKEGRTKPALAQLEAYLEAAPDSPDKEELLAIQSRLRASLNNR